MRFWEKVAICGRISKISEHNSKVLTFCAVFKLADGFQNCYTFQETGDKGKETESQMAAPPVSSVAGVQHLEPSRRSDETSTDNPEESDPGSRGDSPPDRASVGGLSTDCRDTGLYMDMSKSMTLFNDQLVSAPETEQSDDYENQQTWLEHERSKSLPDQTLEQLGQNPVYFNLLNLTKADEQSTPPPPKPHLKPAYVNVHS